MLEDRIGIVYYICDLPLTPTRDLSAGKSETHLRRDSTYCTAQAGLW